MILSGWSRIGRFSGPTNPLARCTTVGAPASCTPSGFLQVNTSLLVPVALPWGHPLGLTSADFAAPRRTAVPCSRYSLLSALRSVRCGSENRLAVESCPALSVTSVVCARGMRARRYVTSDSTARYKKTKKRENKSNLNLKININKECRLY